MLTKERMSKLKYAAVILALLTVLVCCLASCGDATPVSIEYVEGSATKVEYNQNEFFDCTGAQIKVTYDNGSVETKAVTADMVGNAPLMLGVTTIGVTYSENGATVYCSIPVTVNDPYSADRQTAITGLYAVESVVNNSTDKGVATLIRDYTAKINQAGDKAAIDAVVNNFKDAVADYLADKEAVLTELEGVDLSGLYSTFIQDVLSLKKNAIANIKAASTVEEAEDYLAAFKVAVQNKLDEQAAHEGDNENQGQILDKIDILNKIDEYEAKTQLLIEIVTNAYYVDGDINEIVYNQKMYGYVDTEGNTVHGYEYVLSRLAYWEKYITLAINLAGQMDKIDGEVKDLITTPVDKIADLLADPDGITVLPIEYTKDETTGNFVDGDDVTGDLLKQIEAYAQAADDEFGAKGLMTLLSAYGVDTVTGEPIIIQIVDTIDEKYDALIAIRNAAKTADIINLINTAATTADGDAKKTAVDAAWAALKDWGTANNVFALDTTIVDYNNNLVWDKAFEGNYVVELIEGKWNSNNDDEGWSDYAFTENYAVLYFVPNMALLVEATQAQDAHEVKQLEIAIGDVIFSYTDAADADARITAAQTALDNYFDEYGQEIYDKYELGLTQTDVTTARNQYTKLQGMAKEANDAIVAYKEFLAEAKRDVVRSDYEASEGALLKVAYDLYRAFAFENKAKSTGKIYTDVIDYTGASNKSNNETNLIAYMDKYVAQAYKEEKHNEAKYIINAAWAVRMKGEGSIPTDQTDFRTALTKYANEKIAYISADENYVYTRPATVTVGETVVTLTDANDQLYYDEILDANIKTVQTAATEVANNIEIASFKNGALDFTVVAD